MKIKRFEASDMAEALRMVKKEFGEEAVILSAKTLKRAGRLFGGRSGGQVVVTAAVDTVTRHCASASSDGSSIPAPGRYTIGERQSDPAALRPAQGISRILQNFTPITRTGQKKIQPKLSRLVSQGQDDPDLSLNFSQVPSVYERLRAQGLAAVICDELAGQIEDSMTEADLNQDEILSLLTQAIEAKGWVAPPVSDQRAGRRIIVLIGPHGVGKTTTAAKLAAHAIMNAGETAALLSLDDMRIAGTTELQLYADIMGVPFESAGNPEQVKAALQRIADARLVIVDTPGMVAEDAGRKSDLNRALDILEQPEIHLLIHAGAQEQVMAAAVQFYKSFSIDRLLPTHLDWCPQFGPFINQLSRYCLPVSYLGNGPQVPEGLRLLTARYLAGMLLEMTEAKESEAIQSPVTIIRRSAGVTVGRPYVANRNSDVFHTETCKSVSRISEDNMLFFGDPSDAMDQGFKPCRMCCMAHVASKPIDRRSYKHFAGSRI
jgi:flagellar biosynthesis protein FlhF